MTTNPPERQVIQWLLDSDPAIRWQVMQDLLGAPAQEVAAERARVATQGVGARLLALQGADGSWADAFFGRPVMTLQGGITYNVPYIAGGCGRLGTRTVAAPPRSLEFSAANQREWKTPVANGKIGLPNQR